jgi:hypothetical protein
MPAKDFYHDCTKNALIKDGWTITQDPLTLRWGKKEMYVDLGAKKLLAAKKADYKIAVEVKSFSGPSEIKDLRDALGQYILYYDVLAHIEPERMLYLAVTKAIYFDLFEEPIGQLLIENQRIKLIIFDPKTEEIIKWIP